MNYDQAFDELEKDLSESIVEIRENYVDGLIEKYGMKDIAELVRPRFEAYFDRMDAEMRKTFYDVGKALWEMGDEV